MRHLGGLFLLLAPLSWCYILGAEAQSLHACHQQRGFRCSDGLCIQRLRVCDGHKDCEDGSDEQRCDFMSCKKDEFACRSRLCISSHLRCNGVEDCGDGSDEASCLNCSIPGTFSCGPSDTCLPRNKLCDGRTDCKDGRDESPHMCVLPRPRPQTSPVCAPFEFQCGDGHCIRQTWRCDHSPDCSDSSDEDNCDQNECLVDNGGCSHRCVDQLMGFLCDCPSNMKLVGNSQCEEVDPCLESDVCDQLCVHMNGSLTCDCQDGYQRIQTTSECKAKGEEAQLVFPSSQGIRTISVTGTEHRRPALYLPGSGPVATLVSNRTLYWARPGRGSVYRVSLDGNKKDSALVLKVEGSVSGLAVDWIHQLLYWTSMESGSVNVGLLDGSAQRPLITGLDRPSAVAVDPLQGLLLWAQCGNSPQIERSSLQGRDRKPLVTSSIRFPVALSLDMPRQLLYWVDQGMRSISRVNLEGRHRKTVVESNGYLDRPFGLAVFEVKSLMMVWMGHTKKIFKDICESSCSHCTYSKLQCINPVCWASHHPDDELRGFSLFLYIQHLEILEGVITVLLTLSILLQGFLYWSEEVTHSICRANKHNGGNLQVLLSNVTSPGGVVIVQPALQPNGPSVCRHAGTVCQQEYVVDLMSQSPQFNCTCSEKKQNTSQEIPVNSRTVPATSVSDPAFAGILSLIMFLSVLLGGMALWWWREEFRPSRSLMEQSFSLKESQDPLIIQGPHMGPNTRLVKDTLLKWDGDAE